MDKNKREEEILNSAIKVFSRKGYSAATTSEIAKEAGIAEGTIFRYFNTKKDILKSAFMRLSKAFSKELAIERIEKVLEDYREKDEKEVIKAIMRDRLELIKENKELIKVIFTEVQFHQDFREVFIKNVVVPAKKSLENYITAGIKKGVFRNVNVTMAVRTLVGIFAAFIIQSELVPEMLSIDEEKQIDEMANMFLYGISNKKGC